MTSQDATAAQAMMRYDANKKSLLVSYLLWFFLGMFGAHRFYQGRTGSAVAQLLLFLLGAFTWILFIGVFIVGAVGIWVLVDAFLIPGWTSAHNNKLATSLGA